MSSHGGRRWTGSQNVRDGRAAAASPHVRREELAAYLAKLAGEMVELARAADLHLLAYLADMTRLEAEQQARVLRRNGRSGPPRQSSETRPPGSR
jgi:hypothetical protein